MAFLIISSGREVRAAQRLRQQRAPERRVYINLTESTMAATLLRLVRYEIIPLSSSVECLRALPPASIVSVTCSPARGIPATQQLCELLLSHGHTPVPHLAARCVDGPSHAAELAAWVRACSLKEVFIVGGDAPRPVSETYKHALPFMSDFLAAKVKFCVNFHAVSSPDFDPLHPSPPATCGSRFLCGTP